MTSSIFFVGSLPSTDRDAPVFLAAHKKIFFLLDIFCSLGFQVVFINSTPAMNSIHPPRVSELKLKSNSTIPMILPATYTNTYIGRFKNILTSSSLIDFTVSMFGKPTFMWCYNAYAFEMAVAKYIKRKLGVPVVLEFEDWHFARRTHFDFKALLDWFFWRRCISSISYCFAVNNFLRSKMIRFGISSELLPGILVDNIKDLAHNSPPFDSAEFNLIKCGYYGGLSYQKGAHRVIEMINLSIERNLPLFWSVTGSGELEHQFRELSLRFPNHVHFHGLLSDSSLVNLVAQTDVILNPHEDMPGVFPFKLLESVASGRFVLSTPIHLPSDFSWLNEAIFSQNYDPNTWLDILISSQSLYSANIKNVRKAYEFSYDLFGFEGLRKSLSLKINELTKC